MDERVEALLADVLALEGEDPNAFAAICCASSLVIAWRRIVDPAPNPKKVEEGRPHTTFAIATSDALRGSYSRLSHDVVRALSL